MKNTDKGFGNFRTFGGIQNTFQQESSPTKNSRNTPHESRSKTPGTSANRQHVGEGSHMTNESFKRGTFEQCVPSRKEGRGKPSCNQLKLPESFDTIPAFQNGSFILSERNVTEGRFHMQVRHEGCIFFSTTSSILKKICQIFMIREPLRVPLSMLWLRLSTSNIYKTFKSPYISTEVNKYSGNNIPRRYAFDGTNNGGNFNVQRYNHLPSATSGFHFEHGEINFESSSRVEFLGLTVNSVKMTVSLPEQRINWIQDQCQDL